MATKSFLKDVNIKTKKQSLNLYKAIVKAESYKKKPHLLDREHETITRDKIKNYFK